MECPNPECREEVPNHVRHCVVCGADAKAPNVRAASRNEELEALGQRVLAAEQRARLSGTYAILEDFRHAVENASAVICRSLGVVSEMLSNDNQLFGTFYQNIHAEARLPQHNEWDRIRQSVDSLLFPFYYQELRFAALSIDGSGVTGYGEYCIVLKDTAIKERATVFEENTIVFIKRHRIVPGDPLPLGYRATWDKRDSLAAAKLADRLTSSTTPNEYQSMLINAMATDGDFIEVHIYGPLHRRAVRHLLGREPRQRADKVIFRSVIQKLKEVGATWETR